MLQSFQHYFNHTEPLDDHGMLGAGAENSTSSGI